jgi:hypothetical protein
MSSGPLPSLPFATRRELIERAAPLYQEASLAQKGLLLDQVVTLTGYARKYAIQLLNHAPQGRRAILRPRLPSLWLGGATRLGARLGGNQAPVCQTLGPVSPYLYCCSRAPWTSASERGKPKASAPGEHFHG